MGKLRRGEVEQCTRGLSEWLMELEEPWQVGSAVHASSRRGGRVGGAGGELDCDKAEPARVECWMRLVSGGRPGLTSSGQSPAAAEETWARGGGRSGRASSKVGWEEARC